MNDTGHRAITIDWTLPIVQFSIKSVLLDVEFQGKVPYLVIASMEAK